MSYITTTTVMPKMTEQEKSNVYTDYNGNAGSGKKVKTETKLETVSVVNIT
jgi:hypothetical protein